MIDTTITGLYIHDPENYSQQLSLFFFLSLAPSNDFYQSWRQWGGQWFELEQEEEEEEEGRRRVGQVVTEYEAENSDDMYRAGKAAGCAVPVIINDFISQSVWDKSVQEQLPPSSEIFKQTPVFWSNNSHKNKPFIGWRGEPWILCNVSHCSLKKQQTLS